MAEPVLGDRDLHAAGLSCSRRRLLQFATAALGALLLPPARAEQSVHQAPYTVHYAALLTRDLQADVAIRYGLIRETGLGLVVISVQHQTQTPEAAVSIPALVSGEARGPLGDVQELRMRGIRDHDIHYAIGTFDVLDRQTLAFDLQVWPEAQRRAIAVRFQQQFYID